MPKPIQHGEDVQIECGLCGTSEQNVESARSKIRQGPAGGTPAGTLFRGSVSAATQNKKKCITGVHSARKFENNVDHRIRTG